MGMGPLLLEAILAMPHHLLQVTELDCLLHVLIVRLRLSCYQQALLAGNMYNSLCQRNVHCVCLERLPWLLACLTHLFCL